MIKESNSGKVAGLRSIAGVCGITSQFAGVIVILVTVSSSPWFSWTENYISVLGVEGSATMLFNSGLILIGVLSLVFAVGLGTSLLSGGLLGQSGMVSLILGSSAIAAMGIFPRTTGLPHDLASLAFFVFVALALLLIGAMAITTSQMLWGGLEPHRRCCHNCSSVSPMARKWWCHIAVAFFFAMVIVDNIRWD